MWFEPEVKEAWWHGLAKFYLTLGPIPRHVAFIMDGNRRYARKQKYLSFAEGHRKGFDQLTKVLYWCREFGVKEVTIYAFSLENFKRSAAEVTDLLTLFEQKLLQLLDEKIKPEKKAFEFGFLEISVIFRQNYGSLLLKLNYLLANMIGIATVNVCIAYTAQDEMRRALTTIARGVRKGLLTVNDLNESLISHCLDSRLSNDPDLLIRTSGETRLSDFLLWQCSKCCIYFDNNLWPDFEFWSLCKAIYLYQRIRTPLTQLDENYLLQGQSPNNENISEFIRWVDEERMENLQQMSSTVC